MPVVGSDPHLKESGTLCSEELQKAVRCLKAPTIFALQGIRTGSSLTNQLLWKLLLSVAISCICSAQKLKWSNNPHPTNCKTELVPKFPIFIQSSSRKDASKVSGLAPKRHWPLIPPHDGKKEQVKMELKPRSWGTQNALGVEAGLMPCWVDYSFGDVLFDEKLFIEISDFTLQIVSCAKGKTLHWTDCAGCCRAQGKYNSEERGKEWMS